MLGYVNGLRESVYGTDEYNLTLDSNLIAIANRRAKEISVDGNFDHSGATCPENIIGGGGSNMSLYEQFVRWKNSSGHYKNMIEKDFTTFGYGFYASAPNAEIFATQCFGEK